MKLIILRFHIFYTYFTIKKILEVNKKQNKNQTNPNHLYRHGMCFRASSVFVVSILF